MPVTRQRKDMGTTIKLGPMLTAEPEVIMSEQRLEEVMTTKEGNPAFIADTLVSFSVHENMGINLYRTLGALTQNPVLESRFAEFLDDSMQAVDTYEELQTALGIPLGYNNPAGRCQEAMDQQLIASFLTAGGAGPIAWEMAAVNAVFVSASLCVANVEALEKIGESLQGSSARTAIGMAVAKLTGPAREHLAWATDARIAMVEAIGQSPEVQMAAEEAESAYGEAKNSS